MNACVLTNAAGAMCLCFQHVPDAKAKNRTDQAFMQYSIFTLHKGTYEITGKSRDA